MNGLRTHLFRFLSAVIAAVALFSGPAFGANKQYSLTVSPATTSPATLVFTFTNLGNSSFNSLSLTIPPGYTVPPGGVSTSRGVVSVVSGTIQVNNINLPTGSGQVQTVTLAGVTGGTCTAGATGTWYAQPWTGSSVGSGQTFNIIPNNSYPQTTLAPACFTLTYTAGANGSITGVSPQKVLAGANGTAVTAVPNTNYRFVNWSDGSTANPRTDANVQGNITVAANFVSLPKITASAGAGGSITPSGTVYVPYNGSQQFTIAAIATYRILDVLVGGNSVGAASSYTFSNVIADGTIAASFKQNTLAIGLPTNPVVGTAFAVNVGYDGPSPASITVTLTCARAGVLTQTVSPVPAQNPVAFSWTFNSPDTCTFIKAEAPNFKDATNSTGFTVYSGTLQCGDKVGTNSATIDVLKDWSYPQGTALDPGWSLIRGQNKLPDQPCVVVPYTFLQDTTIGAQTATFTVPSSFVPPQAVSAAYVVVWAAVPTTDGWFSKRPKLAWKVDGSNLPIYMPALACVTDPLDFSTVPQAGLDALLPTIPSVAPYNAEPLLSAYPPGSKAKMCVAQHGWTSLGPPSGGETLVQPWTKVIDQGDGFMSLD